MSKVICPYCKSSEQIDYSEGDGTQEGEIYSQHCGKCEKEFDYDTSISYSHRVFCKDDNKHKYIIDKKEKWTSFECLNCDHSYTDFHNNKSDLIK